MVLMVADGLSAGQPIVGSRMVGIALAHPFAMDTDSSPGQPEGVAGREAGLRHGWGLQGDRLAGPRSGWFLRDPATPPWNKPSRQSTKRAAAPPPIRRKPLLICATGSAAGARSSGPRGRDGRA